MSHLPDGLIVIAKRDCPTCVLVEPLLDYPWYRANLPAVYPGLRVPEPGGQPWATALLAANPQIVSVCRTALDSSPPLVCAPAR